ncbi:helix-turn-helix domain-containing protein [Larkinella soli]|uniref:helix-turn-helix domain-containing protein n=1 Tax=Larkinella soli TaxID=1770527 RepID=UPI000FFB61CF|nr:helix-turn-helix domain-containing protein [Larkinella soli]
MEAKTKNGSEQPPVSWDLIPTIIYKQSQQISALTEEITSLKELIQSPTKPHKQDIGGVEIFCEVTGLARQTAYNLTAKGRVPHSKVAGRLWFSRTELIQWLQSGKQKTSAEIGDEVDSYLGSRRRGGRKAA